MFGHESPQALDRMLLMETVQRQQYTWIDIDFSVDRIEDLEAILDELALEAVERL